MIIENNTLIKIEHKDIIDGVFTAPDEVLFIGDNLNCNSVVKMVLPNVKEIGHDFLEYNKSLKHLEIPKVIKIGNYFLFHNRVIDTLIIPNVKVVGFSFLYSNDTLSSIDLPNIEEIDSWFLFKNSIFKYTPKIVKALLGDYVYIDGEQYNKKKYLRNFNIRKILC